jgi:Zn-dependent peptidase ImmA (M78 family)/DNA-binding XRE family transcriptional regulator
MVYKPIFKYIFVNMEKQQVKELFGKRLQQARKMEGLSLRALSDEIGGAVSHNALAKYERGEMMPDGKTFEALAKALKQKDDFFFRPVTAEIKLVEFRDKSKLPEKQEKALRHQAQDHFERYLEIEGLLGIGKKFKNPLAGENYETPDSIEKAADRARSRWKLGMNPILNLVQALEQNGIKVYEIDAPDEFEGFSGWIDGSPIIVINSKGKNILRLRQTLAHELGHILLKGHLSPKLNEDKMARRFAAAFLFPKDAFTQALGGHRKSFTLKELIEIKAAWGISMTSVIMRAKELDLIPNALYRRFWQYDGKKWQEAKGEPGDKKYKGVEKSKRFQKLVYRAIAEEEITLMKACELLDISLDDLRSGGGLIS